METSTTQLDNYQEASTYHVGKNKASSSNGLMIVEAETSGKANNYRRKMSGATKFTQLLMLY